jgi:hypothetical protein
MGEQVRALLVVDPSGVERMVPLDRDVFTLGRDPNCTIRIDSPYVSRQHARIEMRADGPVFVDLGSRNGSQIDGRRVQGMVPLAPGSVIRIADVTIRCLAEGPAEPTTRVFERPVAGAEPAGDRLRIDVQNYEVWTGDRRLERRLSSQEFELLRLLYENRERVCSSQELGDAIWGAGNWDRDMLHRLVYRLKRKLEPDPERPRYIQTVPWIGYRVTP